MNKLTRNINKQRAIRAVAAVDWPDGATVEVRGLTAIDGALFRNSSKWFLVVAVDAPKVDHDTISDQLSEAIPFMSYVTAYN